MYVFAVMSCWSPYDQSDILSFMTFASSQIALLRAARRVFRGESAKSTVWLGKPDGVNAVWKELIEIKNVCLIAMYRFGKERT
jgi:hypothetical protein